MRVEFEAEDAGPELNNYEAHCWANGANLVLEKVMGMDSISAKAKDELTEWVASVMKK